MTTVSMYLWNPDKPVDLGLVEDVERYSEQEVILMALDRYYCQDGTRERLLSMGKPGMTDREVVDYCLEWVVISDQGEVR